MRRAPGTPRCTRRHHHDDCRWRHDDARCERKAVRARWHVGHPSQTGTRGHVLRRPDGARLMLSSWVVRPVDASHSGSRVVRAVQLWCAFPAQQEAVMRQRQFARCRCAACGSRAERGVIRLDRHELDRMLAVLGVRSTRRSVWLCEFCTIRAELAPLSDLFSDPNRSASGDVDPFDALFDRGPTRCLVCGATVRSVVHETVSVPFMSEWNSQRNS